jgi:isopenicillin-N N-acyltransferase like protein
VLEVVGFPQIRASGGPRERGRQYGEQARARVQASVAAYREVFAHYAGWEWDRVVEEARAFRQPIEGFNRAYVDEMEGIAEGAGVSFDDVLAINVRTEVMFAAKARLAKEQLRAVAECSAFGVTADASADGHTLLGQNWDWLLHSFDTVVVLEVAQDRGPDFVTVVEAGLLAKTGFNSSGIGIVTNALVTDDDVGAPGVPYHVALRALFDSENLVDALGALQRSPRSSSANYLLGQAAGQVVDVEATPGDFARLFVEFPDDGVMLHTNHFVSARFDRVDVSLWAMPDSALRLDRLTREVAKLDKLSPGAFQGVLADHASYPSGICCHPDARMDDLDQGATVASVMMDLDTRVMWLAEGQPCSHPYRELDFSEFLSKASPLRPASGE